MRTLVHLSDTHFGRVDYLTVSPLIEAVKKVNPDLVAVSGDLTQRARVEQFKEAREFLDVLPSPQIVVPGNHDVPLDNLFARFLRPLHTYRRYITNNLQPFYLDQEIAVLGINTTRSLTVKGGRINREQVALIRELLCPLGDDVTRVVVTHHPLDLSEGYSGKGEVGNARLAMEMLAGCGIDLFLAGHLHMGHFGRAARYRIVGHSAIVLQAGTAISSRGRGESNSFNVLRIERPYITVERLSWERDLGLFVVSARKLFRLSAEGWALVHEKGE
ncbi:MAG: metallophosphoesterase [Acidobacteria bacterium]|nr:metallophosphoesterase [Acidobacteriota bacterium]